MQRENTCATFGDPYLLKHKPQHWVLHNVQESPDLSLLLAAALSQVAS